MPSRRVVTLILIFWLSTVGFILYRDVWPRLAASGPPPMAIDLSDEASQFVPVRWAVLRDGKKVGRLVTQMTYVDADDTFQFTHRYTHLELDFSGVRIAIPDLTTTTRLTRSGDLREQTMDGKMTVSLERRNGDKVEFDPLVQAHAVVEGRVEGGTFRGRCEIDWPFKPVRRDLDPVPVPSGQALNPLQPVNRISNIRPGQRWVVHEINPLDESLAALSKEEIGRFGLGLPEKSREPLIAQVRSTPETLALKAGKGEEVTCWVIEYRKGEARARTWVRVADGKVFRQEAYGMGETIALERDN